MLEVQQLLRINLHVRINNRRSWMQFHITSLYHHVCTINNNITNRYSIGHIFTYFYIFTYVCATIAYSFILDKLIFMVCHNVWNAILSVYADYHTISCCSVINRIT